MSDKFKHIVIISKNIPPGEEIKKDEENSEEKESTSLNEDLYYSVFTTDYSSSYLVASNSPLLGKEVKEVAQSKNSIDKFVLESKGTLYEFDNCFGETYTIDKIFEENFEFQSLIERGKSLFFFSSQEDDLNNETFTKFYTKFISDYNDYTEKEKVKNNGVILSIDMSHKGNFIRYFNKLLSKKSTSKAEIENSISEVKEKLSELCKEKQYDPKDVCLFISIELDGNTEVCFCKLNVVPPVKSEKNTLEYLLQEINETDKNQNKFFNYDKYEYIFIIATVNPREEKLTESINELNLIRDIMKDNLKYRVSSSYPVINSLRSGNSEELKNSYNALGHSISVANPFLNMSQNPIDNTIIVPDTSMSINEISTFNNTTYLNSSKVKNSIAILTDNTNNGNINDLLANNIKKIYEIVVNEKNQREEQKEELNKYYSEKLKFEYEMESLKKKVKKLEEENSSLLAKEKSNIKVIASLENQLIDLRTRLGDSEKEAELEKVEFKELKRENEQLKRENERYKSKYNDLKKGNEQIEKTIDEIQRKFNKIVALEKAKKI